jgi:hypothetical protein
MSKKADIKGDPIKLTGDLREFNELNHCYKWLELHNMNIQMKFNEGKPTLSPVKYKFSDTLQVKYQDELAVASGHLKANK